MQMMTKHILWPIIDYSSFYAARVTHIQRFVLRRIGRHGHFRSRDKDGGHGIRSAIAKTPAIRKRYGFKSYRTGVIAAWSFTSPE